MLIDLLREATDEQVKAAFTETMAERKRKYPSANLVADQKIRNAFICIMEDRGYDAGFYGDGFYAMTNRFWCKKPALEGAQQETVAYLICLHSIK